MNYKVVWAILLKNWRTTVVGALMAVLATLNAFGVVSLDDATMQRIQEAAIALGLILAKDGNQTGVPTAASQPEESQK